MESKTDKRESLEQPDLMRCRCSYCDAPIPETAATNAQSHTPHYCCYGCRVLGEAGQKPIEASPTTTSPWFKIGVGAVLAGQAMLLGLSLNLTPPTGLVRWILHLALILSSLAALAILGRPLLDSALETLRQRRISIELLFVAGILGALGTSFYSTIRGEGSVYYEVVAVLLTVYSVGKTLGAQSRARALAETRHLQRRFETCHKLAPDGSTSTVPVAEIQPDDQVRVLIGEPIPIDGRITHGQAFICETPLTGEPFPVVRRPGDPVCAGSYSEDGELRVVATSPGATRQLDALLRTLESARERPCRMQSQADSIVRWFLPLVFLTSAGTFLYWTWHDGWATGCFNALAVLLIACPCAMGLATPIALWSALAALAARGLVVRSGDSIERLAELNNMIFDKTGTLSEESFSLIDLATMGSLQQRQILLTQLCAVEQASPHPVARAFHGTDSGDHEAFTVRSVKAIPALGIEAWIESPGSSGHFLRVGQRELMTDFTTEASLLSALNRRTGDHLVYVEADGRLVAIAAVRERLRDSAQEALQQLEGLGIECSVMTGDRAESARQLLGRDKIHGSLTPLAKLGRIELLAKAGRRIGFVGDGVNDAPGMQRAFWSVALSHGAGVTTAGADAVLHGGDLRVLPWAVRLSRQVRASVRSNLLFACAYNAIGMALAATGLLHPIAAALLMVVSSFTVSWRALRSTENVEGCCAITTEAIESPTTSRTNVSRSQKAQSWQQTANGLFIIAQAPFLIYLGQLSATASAWTIAAFVALGILSIRFRTTNPEFARNAQMSIAMLGIGNWGMILGWWADNDFSPALSSCASCLASGSGWLHLAQSPLMNVGMLLFGLPGMLIAPVRVRQGLGRIPLGILASAGMILGMNYGGYALLRPLSNIIAQPVLLSFICMTCGMMLGMLLFCEFGRAVSSAWAQKSRANA